jgi:16S rRNA (cytosine1402-N4)-methyltransferase
LGGGSGGGRAISAKSCETSGTADATSSEGTVAPSSENSNPSFRAARLGTNAVQSDEDGAPHVPVLMRQVLECFEHVHLHRFVDGTMGAGGHASSIVKNHPEMRAFIGFDVDPLAHALAKPRIVQASKERGISGEDDAVAAGSFEFNPVLGNFRELRRRLSELDPVGALQDSHVDGVLMDLGVSSMHLDFPERGFSFNDDGPLDMRMGPSAPRTAFDVVNDWPEDDLARILREYGEEKHWRLLARRICEARVKKPIETTKHLVEALGKIPGVKFGRSGGIHPATRTFQAVRIAVNDELAAVEDAVPAAIAALRPGGRLAVITFHSLEDKIVKNAFKKAAGRIAANGERPYSSWERQPPAPPKVVELVTRKPLVADADEIRRNVRARSAKLRVCEKL